MHKKRNPVSLYPFPPSTLLFVVTAAQMMPLHIRIMIFHP